MVSLSIIIPDLINCFLLILGEVSINSSIDEAIDTAAKVFLLKPITNAIEVTMNRNAA